MWGVELLLFDLSTFFLSLCFASSPDVCAMSVDDRCRLDSLGCWCFCACGFPSCLHLSFGAVAPLYYEELLPWTFVFA
ncbi:hypothetical protein BDQ17DRAFT_1374865 [Cyathus striatus]|nr:hypothetical protein BDQ17DRAFT_1374865 [Cyathus striatus]